VGHQRIITVPLGLTASRTAMVDIIGSAEHGTHRAHRGVRHDQGAGLQPEAMEVGHEMRARAGHARR
jgi:hypothetical protein